LVGAVGWMSGIVRATAGFWCAFEDWPEAGCDEALGWIAADVNVRFIRALYKFGAVLILAFWR